MAFYMYRFRLFFLPFFLWLSYILPGTRIRIWARPKAGESSGSGMVIQLDTMGWKTMRAFICSSKSWLMTTKRQSRAWTVRCKKILLDIFSLLLYRELNGPCILFDFYSGHDVSLVFVNIIIILIILTRSGTCSQPAGSTPRSCSSSTWTRISSSREEARLLSSSCSAIFPINPWTLHI